LRNIISDSFRDSHEEIEQINEYSIFRYFLQPTYDFRQELLSHGVEIEVLSPQQLREEITEITQEMNKIYMKSNELTSSKAYFASGCFWGTEYYFMKADGVDTTAVGFMGGHVEHPAYKQVCTGETGHLECVEVAYDTSKTSYENMVKYFFETHDFTQTNGQGPDIGSQYLSCIFYSNEAEKATAEKYIRTLETRGYQVATKLQLASTFWKAEDYHQQYYEHKGTLPYCHSYKKIF
jgi:peptide methionine sulfoxide reductase msrA/msrB